MEVVRNLPCMKELTKFKDLLQQFM